MVERDKNENYLSKRLIDKSRGVLFGLIGAVLFSLIVGVMANIAVTYFMVDIPPLWRLIILFISIVFTLALFCLVYHLYALSPNSYVRKATIVPIIYDVDKAEVIQDPFDGYFPQMISSSTFDEFKKKCPELAEERIKVDYLSSSSEKDKKHILTELMEFVSLTHLSNELLWPGSVPLQDESLNTMPPDLKENLFLKQLNTDPKHLMVFLPKGVQFKYLSPVPKDGRVDLNTFRFRLVSRQTEVSITVTLLQTKLTSTMKTGPAPVFEGLYIRSYWEAKLGERFRYLRRATFYMEIEAKHKFTLGVFKDMSYIEWADGLIERLLTGGHFPGFDWQEFRRRKLESVIYDVYEEVRETNVLLKKLTDLDKAES